MHVGIRRHVSNVGLGDSYADIMQRILNLEFLITLKKGPVILITGPLYFMLQLL